MAAGIPHELRAYEADVDAEEAYAVQAARALGVEPERMFKTLMALTPDGVLAACVVPASRRLDLRAAAGVLGVKRLAMADPALAERRTGSVRGGISPLGQPERHPVLLDSSAFGAETLLVSAGRRGLAVELSPADLVTVTGARVAEIAAG